MCSFRPFNWSIILRLLNWRILVFFSLSLGLFRVFSFGFRNCVMILCLSLVDLCCGLSDGLRVSFSNRLRMGLSNVLGVGFSS